MKFFWRIDFRFLLGGLVALLCASTSWAQGTKAGAERRIEYDYSKGVSLSQYMMVHGEAVCSLKHCQNNAEMREETKERAYDKAFQRIDQMGRTYQQAQVHYYREFKRLTEQGDSSILNEDIRFIKALEIYDYRHGEYKYSVELGVRRVPRLNPQLNTSLIEALNRIPPKTDEKGGLVFDLSDMLNKMERDEKFKANLERLLKSESFLYSLHFKDDDTQNFVALNGDLQVKIQGYEVGQYTVNALIASLIERSIAVSIRKSLRDYRRVRVLCEGGADRLRITAPISYLGDGKVGVAGHPIPFDPKARTTEGTSLKEQGIRDNVALSFARGYEGIRALSQILEDIQRSGRIELSYTGRGEIAMQSGSNPASRSIRFVVYPESKIQ